LTIHLDEDTWSKAVVEDEATNIEKIFDSKK
jgi:hypothetical protein